MKSNIDERHYKRTYQKKNMICIVNSYYKKQGDEMLPDKLLRVLKRDMEKNNK